MGLFGGGNSRTENRTINTDAKQDHSVTLADDAINIGGSQVHAGGIYGGGAVTVVDGGAITANRDVSQDALFFAGKAVEDIAQISAISNHENVLLAGLAMESTNALAAEFANKASQASFDLASESLASSERTATRAFDGIFENNQAALATVEAANANAAQINQNVLNFSEQQALRASENLESQNLFVSRMADQAFDATRQDSTIIFEKLIKFGIPALAIVFAIGAYKK